MITRYEERRGNIPFYLTSDANYDVLFKYTRMRFAQSMLNDGMFRIGTLYEYQGMEQSEIGDPMEGSRTYHTDLNLPRRAQLESLLKTHPHWEHSNFERFKDGPQDRALMAQEWVPDCYMFCLTREFNRDAMQRFGYDSCIEIVQPAEFLRSLSKEMFKKYAYSGLLRTCQYMDRDIVYTGKALPQPQILKEKRFEHQKEVRLVWDPWSFASLRSGKKLIQRRPWEVPMELSGGVLKAPIFLKCQSATKYCRLIF